MKSQNFTATLSSDQTPKEVFQAVTNVRAWWSGYYAEEIKGNTEKLNDEFTFKAGEGAHYSKQQLVEVIPDEKIVWLITDSELSFLKKKDEWTGTKVIFEISKKENKTQLVFTHEGLSPSNECYDSCAPAWSQYLNNKLKPLIQGNKKPLTTQEVATRFNELAQQEKWFEIQDELFSDNVTSTDPAHSPWFGYAEGKAAVRKKGEDVVKKIVQVNRLFTTEPLVWGNHFAVGREQDTIHEDFGRMHINQIMLYEVRDGKIISEQFFY